MYSKEVPRPRLILFRTPTDEDAYETLFQQHGWDVRSIPVLAFTYTNQETLKASLSASASFGGIIVTSPRAGDLLATTLSADPGLRERWQEKPIFCIGERTASQLFQCGLTPRIADRADSIGVAQQVVEQAVAGRWLFICGKLRREELPAFLTLAGVPFEELHVYETHPRINLNLHELDAPDCVVFFSPSGVDAAKDAWPQYWSDTKKAAIGMTTARAIEDAGWEVASVAKKPEAESLLLAITPAES